MATFVICHGAYDGGWSWQSVRRHLQRLGHEAYTPTLTGLGERVHLARPDVDLETHIRDIVHVVEYEDLRDVILVGHSYGGVVVTGAAEHIAERVRRIVYVDGFVPRDGEAVVDLYDPELVAFTEEYVHAVGEGWRIPPADDADRRIAAQPWATYTQPIRLRDPRAAVLPRTYISCTQRGDAPQYAPAAAAAARARSEGWQLIELASGHNPNETIPDRLAELLVGLAEGDTSPEQKIGSTGL